MDDEIKIQILMIYYNHWGKYEINSRKVVSGIKKTMNFLNKEFVYNDLSLQQSLKSLFYNYSDDHISSVYKLLIELLLEDYGGYYDDDWNYELENEDDLLFDKKYLLEQNIGDLSSESSDILYSDDFNASHRLSVEAIVGLKPIHQYDSDFFWEYSKDELDEMGP